MPCITADLTGRRNSLVKSLSWCFVVQRLPRHRRPHHLSPAPRSADLLGQIHTNKLTQVNSESVLVVWRRSLAIERALVYIGQHYVEPIQLCELRKGRASASATRCVGSRRALWRFTASLSASPAIVACQGDAGRSNLHHAHRARRRVLRSQSLGPQFSGSVGHDPDQYPAERRSVMAQFLPSR